MTDTDNVGEQTHCRLCERTHGQRWVCDAMQRIVTALYARGTELTMPDVTFSEPIMGHELGLGLDPAAGDRLAAQITVTAATIQVAGSWKPTLILSGLDSYSRAMPKWVYAGDPVDIDSVTQLMHRMAGLSIRSARKQNKARPA